MHDIIVEIVNNFGYFGVFMLITVENIFPPIPSELILTFAGFMTTHSNMHIWGVTLASTIGSVLGAILLYVLGRVLNADRLDRLCASKLGRMLHLKQGDIKRAEKWFLRRGNRAVFLCRFVPIVRSLISIPAGMSKMKWLPFLGFTAAGTLIWNITLVLLGRAAGAAWENIAHYFDVYTLIAAVALCAVAGTIGFIYIKKRFLNNHD